MSRGKKKKKNQEAETEVNPEIKQQIERDLRAALYQQLEEGACSKDSEKPRSDSKKDQLKASEESRSKSQEDAQQRPGKEIEGIRRGQPDKNEDLKASTEGVELGDGSKEATASPDCSKKDPNLRGLGTVPSSLNKVEAQALGSSINGRREGAQRVDSRPQIWPVHRAAVNNRPSMRAKAANWKSFSQVVRGSHCGDMAGKLDFIPDVNGDRIEQYDANIVDAAQRWEATLIGAVMGNEITIATLTNFMKKNWLFDTPVFLVKDTGVIIMKFKTFEQRDWVLANGPWSIDSSRPLLLKAWNEGMSMDWSSFKEVPVWVRIPDLPPVYCSKYMLSLIGSGIGKPVCTDKYTASHELLSYARLLIEVNVEQTHRKSVKLVNAKGMECELRVNFEWLPNSCEVCLCFGHSNENCPQKNKDDHIDCRVGAAETGLDLSPSEEKSCCELVDETVQKDVSPCKDSEKDAVKNSEQGENTAPVEGEEVLIKDGVEEEVFSGEYTAECVRLVATAWAADVGILDDDIEDDEEGNEVEEPVKDNAEEGMNTPVAVIRFKYDDGTESLEEYNFKQVKTKGVIPMSTKVTLSLDQIYEAFEIIKAIEYESDEEDGEGELEKSVEAVEEGSEEEIEDDVIKDKTYKPKLR